MDGNGLGAGRKQGILDLLARTTDPVAVQRLSQLLLMVEVESRSELIAEAAGAASAPGRQRPARSRGEER